MQHALGSIIASTSDLLRGGKKVGSDFVTFTAQAGNTSLIYATIAFPNGHIIARGSAVLKDPIVLPVISGTGAYANAMGTLTADHGSATQSDLTIRLR